MSLRYLDINPMPISEEGIYGINKETYSENVTTYKFLPNKIDRYSNNTFIDSSVCASCNSGFQFLGVGVNLLFYNLVEKKYYSGTEEFSYSGEPFFVVYTTTIMDGEDFTQGLLQYVDLFSSFALLISNPYSIGYIGKKNGKLTKLLVDMNTQEASLVEYNGQKISSVESRNIFYILDIEEGNNIINYLIFKVGKNLYKYNPTDDFVDDNIILWAVLPNDIENLSIGLNTSEVGGFKTFLECYLVDVDNHNYYTATFTDIPPTPPVTSYTIRFLNYDGSLLETKEVEEGTTPTYTGSTPIREGYTFTGWTPALYPANKNQDYTAVFKQNARDVTINYKLSNSEDIFYTTTINNIINAITKIEIDTTLTFNVKFYTSDGSDYPTYYSGSVGGKDVLPYIESYKYGENTYLANKFNNVPTEISTNDTTEEITIIFNVGNDYHYKIQFLNRSVSPNVLHQVQRLLEGETPVFSGKTQPSKEGYNFVGWNPIPYPVNKNQDYVAVFEIIKTPYAITLEDSSNEPFTSTPTSITFNNQLTRILFNNDLFGNPYIYYVDIDGEHTINITYTNKGGGFTRITLESIEINGETYSDLNTWFDLDISSAITITLNSVVYYYIQFKDDDEFSLYSYWCLKGSTPVYGGSTPSKTGYDFIGWTPALYPADKEQVYTATYQIKTFTIRFLNDDRSVLESKSVNYGETPTYTGTTPTKEGYTFNGWSPTLYPANKNQDYTATYRNNAFALTLYKNSAENNRIDKTEYLTSVGEITGYLRNETNIINPSIVIEYDKVIDFNYVYVSTFNRYYFVTNITSVRTNLWRIDMSCDTLMTYKETILNYECYVSRNENDYNDKIEDKYLPLEYEKEVDYILQQDTIGTNTDFFKGFSALITTLATSPEVNLESENIEITTPFNDLDGEPAKTNIYEVGSSNFKVVQMITDVGAYADCMNTIANALIEDDNKAGYVQSIIVFPIWNPAMYDQIGYKTMTDFYYGSEKLPLGGTYNVVLKGDTIAPIKVATIYIRPKFNNFLDYDPYTTYEIWLPFHGWVKLPSEQVVGNYLIVYYVINTSSTKGTIIIRQQSDSAVILQVDCTIGVEIPISTTNGEDIKRRQTSDAINLAVQGVGGVLMGAVGVVTGNPLLAFGGAMMATGAITGGISSSMTNRVEAQGKVSDGNAGLYSDRVVKIRRTSSIVAVDDISKYAKYIGRPLQTNVKLNTLTGYTIVGGVHIENLDTATDNEKTDIENQLRKGVII